MTYRALPTESFRATHTRVRTADLRQQPFMKIFPFFFPTNAIKCVVFFSWPFLRSAPLNHSSVSAPGGMTVFAPVLFAPNQTEILPASSDHAYFPSTDQLFIFVLSSLLSLVFTLFKGQHPDSPPKKCGRPVQLGYFTGPLLFSVVSLFSHR